MLLKLPVNPYYTEYMIKHKIYIISKTNKQTNKNYAWIQERRQTETDNEQRQTEGTDKQTE